MMDELPLFASRRMPYHNAAQIMRDTGAHAVWLGGPPAGSQPNECSEDAADAQTPDRLHRGRRLVLAFVASRGSQGATADECCAALAPDGDRNGVSPRCTELLAMQYLRRTTTKRRTRKGATAFVLTLTPAGRKALTP